MASVAAVQAKTSDRSQTMTTQSDRTDCSVNESAPCLLIGNVHVVQGTLDIKAAKADVRRANGDVSTVRLTGSPVQMKQQNDDGGWINATAGQIDYDMSSDTIVLTGDASVQQPGKGGITGGRIVYNTRTGQVQSGGEAGGGRVNMTFEPKNKAPAADKRKPADQATPPAEPPKQDQD
jgi:lipopolysaccharide export system protein LptA